MRNLNFLRIHRRYSALKHLAFMLLFLLGSLNVWGETAIITFANQTSGTNDGSAAYTTSNFVSNGIASSDDAFGTITCSATDKCYSGKVNMGLKSGAKSSAGSFTISFSTPITNVTQITLNRAAYNSTKSATITVKNGTTTLANEVSTGTNASLNNMDITDLNIASLSGLTVETSKYCYIKSITITYTPSGGSDPTVTLTPTSKSVAATDVENQSVTITPANFSGNITSVTPVLYSDEGCTEAITSGAWVTNITVNGAKTAVTFDVADNYGAARNCWMKITASDGTGNASAVLAISQAKYEAPATLPFAYDGNGTGELPNGLSVSGTGTYNSSPAIKFDDTGDYILIHFSDTPGKLTYTIKGNSFSGGTFKVQESADGVNYTDVKSYSSLGDAQNEEYDLNSASRYVKFIYTNKSNGNVALGNIAISKYVAPASVATPEISGDDNFYPTVEVSMSCETDGASIYYTTDATEGAGDPSTDTWTPYDNENKPSFSETTTVYAAAKKGNDWSNKANKTFTKIVPLTTMAEVQAAVPSSGTVNINVTISNWVVTAVSGNQVWIADATNEKGILLYKSGHGFAVGNQLNGTVLGTGLTKYNGAAELNSLTKADVSVTTAAALTPRVTTIAALTSNHPVEQGTVVKLENVTYNGTAFSDGVTTIIIDTRFYNPTLESSKKYDLIGVVFYGSSNAIKLMPRLEADVKEIIPAGAPEFEPTSQKFLGSIDVTLSQSASLPIYYTDNASIKDDPSTSTWTEYTSAINVTATKTIYAAAKDGDDWSDVSSATYTLAEPLTTMEAVQGAATSTESNIDVTINNWVVTGIDGSQVWLTDASNEKGILLYKSSNGFAVNKKLNGIVFDTKIKLWNNYPELTSLVASDVSATDAETITPRVTTIAALTSGHPAEQGTIVKLENLTYNGSVFSDGTNTITIDTRFFEPSLTSGKKYDLSGVVYYGSTVATIKIMPRAPKDVVELASHDLTSITLGGTYPTTFETGDAFSHEGMVVTAHYEGAEDETVTASATFSGYDMSATGEQTVTVTYEENEVSKTAEYTITVNAPAPTGDFEEFDGELVADDYLIYYDGNLLLAGVTDGRLDYQADVEPVEGTISDPSKYAVWTLAKSGDYWTLYNAKTGMYAASTGAKNKAQLLADGADDKSLWTISDGYEIVNKQNTTNGVNANLRFNSGYGFACYATGTGGALSLYKKAAPSYSISATLTGCTADAENAKKVPQALDNDIDLKYNLTTGYAWPNEITVKSGETTLTAGEDYIWDNTSAPAELLIVKEAVNGNITITIEATEKSLDNITIAQAPAKVAYETGESFNPAGLQIQLNYTAGASDVVDYSNETKDAFTFSPDLETALAPANTEVTITYGGKSVNQAITVTDPVAEAKTVVIIAEFDSKFYAMSNAVANSQCVAIEVTKNGDNLVVSSDEDKAAIQWYMSKLGSTVNLQEADENGKYLSGNSSNASFAESDDKVDLTMTQADGKYIISAGGARAIMYRSTGVFKHYATSSSESEYAKVSEIFEVADGAMNIEVVVPVVHEFVVDPDEDVDFGTVELNETVAAKSFDVTLTNIANATVTLEGGNGAFSIDKSTLDENGGTITVTPNTANEGNFSATITLHDEDDAAADKVINVTMKVVAPKDCDRTDDFNTVDANNSYLDRESDEGWNAVNTAVVVKDEVTYWMINGKTSAKGVITSPEFNYGIKQLSFDYYYSFNESNGISFKVEIKQNGSVVKTETITKADAVKNTIYSATIENIDLEGKYQIVFTNLCPSNSTSNADRFAIGNLCWKKYGEPVYDVVRSGLEINRYYTVCLPKKVTAIKGASFWTLNNKSQDGATAYLEEETNNLPFAAGKPFIIQATAEKLEVVYEGAATEEAGTNGALHGTLIYMNAAALAAAGSDIYMLFSNELRPVGENNHLDANRAYVKLSELNAVAEAPQSALGRRVRAMPMQPQVATGFEAAEANEAPRKVLINGEFFIIRGEKMYDAKGQLVK